MEWICDPSESVSLKRRSIASQESFTASSRGTEAGFKVPPDNEAISGPHSTSSFRSSITISLTEPRLCETSSFAPSAIAREIFF